MVSPDYIRAKPALSKHIVREDIRVDGRIILK
jgi:hypothetical protein